MPQPLRPCPTCGTITPNGHCPDHPRRTRKDRPSSRQWNTNYAHNPQWQTTRRDILNRDHWTCTYCGNNKATIADHITPRHRGGTDHPNNLTAACRTCNGRKGTRTLAEWIATGTAPGGARRLHRSRQGH